MKTFTKTFDGTGLDEWTLPGGTYLRILSASTPLSLIARQGGSLRADLSGVGAGLAWESLNEHGDLTPFDEVRINSAAAQTVTIAVGRGRLLNDALTISTAIPIAQGTAITNDAPVVVGVAAIALAAASAGRQSLRFKNDGNSTVYLGGAGVTLANSPVQLAPGQVWVESDGAAAAWFGISAVAGQSVRVQEIS